MLPPLLYYPLDVFTNSNPEWDFQDLVRNGMIPQPFSAMSKHHHLPKQQNNIANASPDYGICG
jgi:hypothetical protein